MDFATCVDDGAFGPIVKGCRGDFDFTLKFEKIILSMLPSAVFITLSVPRGIFLACRPSIAGGATLQYIKLAAAAVYTILQLVLFIFVCIDRSKLSGLSITADALSLVAAICISALSFLEHSRSPRPSILLSVYLSLTFLFDIAQVRSLWLLANRHHEMTYVRCFTVATVWKVVLILLESLHRQRWLNWDRKTHSPEETTGFYGLGSFLWLNPLFVLGYKKDLKLSDLFSLDKDVSAEVLQTSFVATNQQLDFHGDKNGLTKALARTLVVSFLLPVVPRVALIGFSLCQPFLIEAVLNSLEEPNTKFTINKGYGLIGATILIYTGMPIATALYWYLHERALFMVRACLASAIYHKTTQAQVSIADDSAAVTLMSADIERIRMGFMQFHEFWANPIQVAIVCWLLYRQLGTAMAAPVVVVVICIACSTVLMRFVGPRQMAWMQTIQKRVGHTASAIGNMKHLKISGIALPVEEAIQGLRVDELNVGGKFRTFLVGSVGIGFTPILLGPVFTFALTSCSLNVTTIFTSLSYLQLLFEPLSSLFQVAPQLLAGFSCLSRIQLFLEKEPRRDPRQFNATEKSIESKSLGKESLPVVEIRNGEFGWNKHGLTLQNINLAIPRGLTMVVGPIASGKSTLCKAILGETPIARGEVIIRAENVQVGYCDQVPFLPNETARDIIVGFSAFDEKRYNNIIEATMLSQDFHFLPRGDRTKVGSNGLALSGGQKQRISLARALYLQCDLLILDDIMSGLDADTAEYIFHSIFGPVGILKQREVTVILCTHTTRHLVSADYIVALASDGSIMEQGCFQELVANGQYIRNLGVQADTNTTIPTIMTPLPELRAQKETSGMDSADAMSTGTVSDDKKTHRHTRDTAVFAYYSRSIGAFCLSTFILIGILCGFFSSFPTIWLNFWSEDAFNRPTSFYIGIYALFQCLALATLVTEAAIGMLIIIRSSGARLHQAALRTLFAAPLSFFSKTDTGIVTNLFSQDMTLIDGELPQALINTSLQTCLAVGNAAVLATSSPYILVTYPFVLLILYGVQRFYLRTSRQLRLLDLEAKSPLYTHFLDTIKGVATLRAFGWTEPSISLNNVLLDNSQRPAYLLSMIQRWLAFVLSMVIAVIALLVVTLATQLRPSTGFTGASMVLIMSFSKTLGNLVQMYTLLETSIGAVSRLKSFSDNTSAEDLPGEDFHPPPAWPERGRIEILGVSASYSDSGSMAKPGSKVPFKANNAALRDLTLIIEPGQKLAICGRTGSGKSSIVLLLLRLLDPVASCTGELSIDGASLRTIDRSTLRQRVIAVPQDPTFLPDGTSFRGNLDPFTTATDEECQAVLEIVGLWALVCDRGGLTAGLVVDALSNGQKQLFSLARAVLRRRVRARELAGEVGGSYLVNSSESSHPAGRAIGNGGVLLLDEFTSGVDAETEKTMQDITSGEFQGYTVVMISHRLDMVMDFDRVLVMDQGSVVEDGSPKELIERTGGRFKHLWTTGKTGKAQP